MIAFEPAGRITYLCKAIFLDRDGVLIENCDGDYARSIEDIRMIPNASEAVRRWNAAGFRTIVVSNQAAVAKGLMTASAVVEVHREVIRRFASEGAELWAGYICSHSSWDGCDCRKPKPGMIHRAAARLGIDLSQSYLIGDALTDLAAAKAAGVAPHLVLTGRGSAELHRLRDIDLDLRHIHEDILAATEFVISQQSQ